MTVLGIFLALFIFWPELEGRVYYEIYFGFLFLIVLLAQELSKKIHWSVGVSFCLIALSALAGFFFPLKFPIHIEPLEFAKAPGEILFSLVGLLIFAITLLTQKAEFFRGVFWLLFFSAVFNGAMIAGTSLWGQNYGMLNNCAADSSFMACLMPVAFHQYFNGGRSQKRLSLFFIFVLCLGILRTGSSTGLAGIGVGMAFILLHRMPFKKWILWMLPLTAFFVGFGFWHYGSNLLVDSGRGHVFGLAWEFYQKYANPWLGAGTGTFTVWGVAHQKLSQPTDLWVWLHNEYLEIIFENGILGLASVLTVYFFMLQALWKKRSASFTIAVVYGFTALTEMPLRLFVTQLLGVCLLSEAFLSRPYPHKPSGRNES